MKSCEIIVRFCKIITRFSIFLVTLMCFNTLEPNDSITKGDNHIAVKFYMCIK